MRREMLQKFRLDNFKAVQSAEVELTPLTALIGYNGSGKSSLIEGLETLQVIAERGLDEAMYSWRGFEYVWNQATSHKLRSRKLALIHLPVMSRDIIIQTRCVLY